MVRIYLFFEILFISTALSFGYDREGRLRIVVNESNEQYVLNRDSMSRVVKEECNGEEVSGKYDISGRRIHVQSSLGADIEAAYNPFGDLTSMTSGEWNVDYKRDAMGLEIERLLPGNLRKQTERDVLGRVTEQNIFRSYTSVDKKSYLWGANDRLLAVTDNGKERRYDYDSRGFLTRTLFEDGTAELRNPDKMGNLFETKDFSDRKYAKGGQLLKTRDWEYKYDDFGNLVRKKDKHGATWRYEWNAAGMLERVTRPDAREISFKYDALGRRIEKRNGTVVTRWVWDGNVPLHEMVSQYWQKYDKDKHQEYWDEEKRPTVTWVFEEGTFVPAAKLTEKKNLSIVSNYMGTPEAMFREDGEKVWSCELNSYGKVRNYQGETKTDCPFRYQGQYHDADTGLYYNRFRYYDPESGSYLSQDTIGLEGNNPTLYAYVYDTNLWIDLLGLWTAAPGFQAHHVISRSVWNSSPFLQNSGLSMNGASNRVDLPTVAGGDPLHPNSSTHHGWNTTHSDYNTSMKAKVDALETRSIKESWSPDKIQQEIQKLQDTTKQNLQNGKTLCG